VAAFVATNVDDLFLLVAWFAGGYRASAIIAGQYLGIGALFAAAAAASLASLFVPVEYLRWLGLLPILIGLGMLLRRGEAESAGAQGASIASVTAVTVANGADNIGVYLPLFAVASPWTIAAYGAVFAAMIALWCLGARWLVRHPAAGSPLRRWGPRLVPWVLVALGIWILAGEL
jgi:cadmium resistance protein CadD (predicted permease)